MFMKPVNIHAALSARSAKFSSTGLAIQDESALPSLPGFLDSVFRGIGQVMLQDNSYAGLIFLAGVFYNSILLGWALLLGTIASTATAMLLGVDRSRILECPH